MNVENKVVVKDDRLVYVYYTNNKKEHGIVGSWNRYGRSLASIEDVKNHWEIWDCPLRVAEGFYSYKDGEYVKSSN